MSVELNTVPEAVEAIRRGEVVIVVDAEDRENEGDYICAAEKATPEAVNFMLSGRGQLCVSILPEVSKRLDLNPVCCTRVDPGDDNEVTFNLRQLLVGIARFGQIVEMRDRQDIHAIDLPDFICDSLFESAFFRIA
ncbi:3,4-dihydroxy-2-butanone-4-phosphate synthase [bacterium]|nr:3,4-dihydroxy-2-butanone-4-phosphate synthase [bacterium]